MPSPAADDDDEDDVDIDVELGEEQDNSSGSIAQLSKSLVRYALSCEYARIPIKRQDISQKGMTVFCIQNHDCERQLTV